MHIYKFTHVESGRSYIGQTVQDPNHRRLEAGGNKLHSEESKKRMSDAQKQAHARRRNEGRDTFVKIRKTSGWAHSEESKAKRKEWSKATNAKFIGKTWKVINSKRVWMEKE